MPSAEITRAETGTRGRLVQVDSYDVAQIDAFLAAEDRDPGLVRVLVERRDIVQRALRSRALVIVPS